MPTNTIDGTAARLVSRFVNLKEINRTSTGDPMTFDGGSIASPGIKMATSAAASGDSKDHEMILPPLPLLRLAAPNPFSSESGLALDTIYLKITLALDNTPEVDASIDANVWASDGEGGINSGLGDLVSTAVQDVDGNGTSTVTYTFAVDASGLARTDLLLGYFRILIDDTGGANNVKAHVYEVEWQLYERG